MSTSNPAAANSSTSTAAGVCWNLGDLYAGLDDPRIEADLTLAGQRARTFIHTRFYCDECAFDEVQTAPWLPRHRCHRRFGSPR